MKTIRIAIVIFACVTLFPLPAFAQAEETKESGPALGLLPGTKYTFDQCNDDITRRADYNVASQFRKLDPVERTNYLGCAVKTGKIKMFMFPFFITTLIEFLIGLAGIICVLFIVIGGYQFVTGGMSDQVDTAKKTLKYAIMGLVVSITAWIVVNIVQVAVTS